MHLGVAYLAGASLRLQAGPRLPCRTTGAVKPPVGRCRVEVPLVCKISPPLDTKRKVREFLRPQEESEGVHELVSVARPAFQLMKSVRTNGHAGD
jgi:hypothetical protein